MVIHLTKTLGRNISKLNFYYRRSDLWTELKGLTKRGIIGTVRNPLNLRAKLGQTLFIGILTL
jgi:hypothetical protein